jgi:hypothetical protein
MKKSYIIIALLIILSFAGAVYWTYNKPHRDPLTEPTTAVTAIKLFHDYETNETEANKLYLDKVLEINGQVIEITSNQELSPIIVLETENPLFSVRCTMISPTLKAHVGDRVTIKGICTGYLSDVIIVKATLIE